MQVGYLEEIRRDNKMIEILELSRWLLLVFGSFQFPLLSLEVVRVNPALFLRELDVDIPVGLSYSVDPLLHPLGEPLGDRRRLTSVGAPV